MPDASASLAGTAPAHDTAWHGPRLVTQDDRSTGRAGGPHLRHRHRDRYLLGVHRAPDGLEPHERLRSLAPGLESGDGAPHGDRRDPPVLPLGRPARARSFARRKAIRSPRRSHHALSVRRRLQHRARTSERVRRVPHGGRRTSDQHRPRGGPHRHRVGGRHAPRGRDPRADRRPVEPLARRIAAPLARPDQHRGRRLQPHSGLSARRRANPAGRDLGHHEGSPCRHVVGVGRGPGHRLGTRLRGRRDGLRRARAVPRRGSGGRPLARLHRLVPELRRRADPAPPARARCPRRGQRLAPRDPAGARRAAPSRSRHPGRRLDDPHRRARVPGRGRSAASSSGS